MTLETMTLKRNSQQALSTDSKTTQGSPMKTFVVPKVKSLDDHSLATMMTSSRRSGLQSLHQKFADELEQQRRKVSFGTDVKDPLAEPPMKRRRFQRRNSKTAAMLLSSMASIVAADFDEPEEEKEQRPPKSNESRDDEAWDGGLQIAEELVRQLKLRRQSLNHAT